MTTDGNRVTFALNAENEVLFLSKYQHSINVQFDKDANVSIDSLCCSLYQTMTHLLYSNHINTFDDTRQLYEWIYQ